MAIYLRVPEVCGIHLRTGIPNLLSDDGIISFVGSHLHYQEAVFVVLLWTFQRHNDPIL